MLTTMSQTTDHVEALLASGIELMSMTQNQEARNKAIMFSIFYFIK